MLSRFGLGLGGVTGGGGPSDIITSIFADGTDGFYFDFSKTDRLFQSTTSTTPADDPGENIALALESHGWAGKPLAALSAAQPELSAPFVVGGAGWSTANTDATHIVTFGSGSMRFQSDTTTPILQVARSGLILTVGNVYEVTVVCSAYTSGSLKTDAFGGNTVVAAGVGTVTFRAKATGNQAMFLRNTSNVDLTLSSVSIKEIPGNHGTQSTAAAQPKYQTGGLARFDGLDDGLLTTLSPAAAMTFMFKGKLSTGTRLAMGAAATATTAAYLGLSSSGNGYKLAAGVGSQGLSTIIGGDNIQGVVGVRALTWDGSTVKLYSNGVQVYSDAQVGPPTTAVPIALGAYNNNGTLANFGDADIYHALAIKKALTAAQIAAITNKWGTT